MAPDVASLVDTLAEIVGPSHVRTALPERVTYAPGPSFRKLMDRIDGHASPEPRVRPSTGARAPAASAAVR